MENEKRLIDASPDDCIKKVKRKTNFAKIIVSGTAVRPYYEIMWFDYMDGQYNIGYGSYNIHFVFQWLSECFEIEDAPTVDAVEVVHGQWIYEEEPDENNNVEAHCSVCFAGDLHATALMNKVPYCWKCCAKMDGGNEDG